MEDSAPLRPERAYTGDCGVDSSIFVFMLVASLLAWALGSAIALLGRKLEQQAGIRLHTASVHVSIDSLAASHTGTG